VAEGDAGALGVVVLDAVLAAETEVQLELLATNDFAEGRAAFLERRNPVFTGS
jgi:enoyl-CoA hydratase/carnithine racemase